MRYEVDYQNEDKFRCKKTKTSYGVPQRDKNDNGTVQKWDNVFKVGVVTHRGRNRRRKITVTFLK